MNPCKLSLFVDRDNLDDAQVERAFTFLKRVNAATVLIFGGSRFEQARKDVERLNRELPGCTPILRNYGHNTGGLNDNGILAKIGAQAWHQLWVEPIRDWLKRTNVVYHIDNEGTIDDMATYAREYAQAIKLCQTDNIPVGYGAFSVGTPNEAQYEQLVPMFAAAAEANRAGYPGKRGSIWMVHNGLGQTQALSNSLPDHWRRGLEVCRKHGIAAPLIVNGEFAAGHAYMADGRIIVSPSQGYKDLGWSEGEYFLNLLDAWKNWVEPFVMGSCIFKFSGGGDHQSFIVGESMLEHIESWWKANSDQPGSAPQPPPAPVVKRYRIMPVIEVDVAMTEDRRRAIEDGLRMILTGAAWFGQGVAGLPISVSIEEV